jgi:signal transduction histidine kinase
LLTKEEEINLFRIIQESLNNVIKHAEATSVSVSLKRSGESVRAVIRDNGKGFDFDSKNLQSKFASGLGLKSLRERAKLLGSDIAIESAPMKGTTISLTIKLKERH